ncbi:MAG: PKD domain-containing protein, partial [Planctomycetes bacterium]|nr:PKD domain-containing protein [Planctomycetota bacterium]
TVTVDASASTSPNGAITAYSWDFGDGATAEGVTSEHTYQTRGGYTIRLDVTDESGDQGQAANTVRAAFRSDGIAPWTLQDIGEPPPAIEGGARLEGDACLRVLAGGAGIRSRSDQFSFAYQQLPTSGPFIARIGEAAWAGRGRIGLMIREDLDPDSRFAAIVFADTGFRGLRYSFLRREEKAGIVRTTNSPENFEVGDAWIRLEYEAGEIIGSWSVDRKNWTELYRAVFDLPAEAYGGIASTVQSLGEGDEFEATLCDISTGTDNPPPPPPEICGNGIDDDENGLADCLDPQCAGREECLEPAGARLVRGDSNSDGSINLTDGVIPLIFLFSGGAPPACMDSADANDTGNIEITDAIIIFSWLFTGGAPPAPPTPSSPGYPAEDCGIDDTEDGLGCESPTRVCD